MSEDAVTEQRRAVGGTPPTALMAWYQGLSATERARLYKIGAPMLLFGVGMPMAVEPFKELSWVYWVFSGFVALAGLCLLCLPIGIMLLERVPAIMGRFIPGAKRVERRGERAE